MRRVLIIAAVALAVAGFAGSAVAFTPEDVSMVQLLATPEKFDGRPVHVVGYARFISGEGAVYLSDSDGMRQIDKNALALVVTDRQMQKRESRLDRQYVFVEGIFHADNKGRQELYSGTIDAVSRLELLQQDL